MKFPLFDRRRQRLTKLATLLATDDDDAIALRLRKASPEELALVLRTLPVARCNVVLATCSSERLQAALALVDVPTAPAPATAAERAGALGLVPIHGDAPLGPTPVCVRALDLAGKILGHDDADGER